MRRVVSVWLPTLPTDRLRRGAGAPPPDLPLVARAHDGRRQVVAAADRAALALGLHPGLALAEAQARVPGLAVRDADPDGDAEALRRIAAWCLRYTPLLAPAPPDGLLLDVTGCGHLYGEGGEAALLADLLGRLRRVGLAARATAAGTPGAAYALARFGPAEAAVVPPGGEAEALADLPVAALRLLPDVAHALGVLGLGRVGQLLAVPRAPLARRFGAAALARLDMAVDAAFEPIAPWTPPETVQHRLAFPEPLAAAAALGAAIDRLVGAACADLGRAGQGARLLDLLFERVDGSAQPVRVGTARPSRDPRHLGRLLRERLEAVDPGFGIEAMRLVVSLAEPLAPEQSTALGAAGPPPVEAAVLVDRIGSRLGPGRVFRVVPVESGVPERSLRRVPALARATGATWPAELPRPVRVLAPPQPVEALAALPDGPPATFTWRRVRRRVRRADGPERVFGEWWLRDAEAAAVRDYWRVEDEEGRRWWLFRRGDGEDAAAGDLRWFLHGLF